ncbi:MAG: hypothetical protein ACREV9_08135 [Burkholderiales bacterium]
MVLELQASRVRYMKAVLELQASRLRYMKASHGRHIARRVPMPKPCLFNDLTLGSPSATPARGARRSFMVQRANPLRRRAHLLLIKKLHDCGANIVVGLALHELQSRPPWQYHAENLTDGHSLSACRSARQPKSRLFQPPNSRLAAPT